jgi:D-tyrosyl-tRNA(Tyr) deacylase
MRAVIQRVNYAKVVVDDDVAGAIDRGFLVLLGVTHGDTAEEASALASKIAKLRVFTDPEGKMNLALADIGGAVLAVSQFTLYADASHGNRPSFINAARPELAESLYELFCEKLQSFGLRVEKGVFGAHMDVSLLNDGPVTIILDSDDLKRKR